MIDTHHPASFSHHEGSKKHSWHLWRPYWIHYDTVKSWRNRAQVRLHSQSRFFQASWTYLQTDPSHDWVSYELLKWPCALCKKSKTGRKLRGRIVFSWLPKLRSSTVNYTRPYSNDCGFSMRPLTNNAPTLVLMHMNTNNPICSIKWLHSSRLVGMLTSVNPVPIHEKSQQQCPKFVLALLSLNTSRTLHLPAQTKQKYFSLHRAATDIFCRCSKSKTVKPFRVATASSCTQHFSARFC